QPKRRESLIEHADKARLSRELVKLDDHVPLPCPLSELAVQPIDPNVLLPWLKEMEFRTLGTRMARRRAGDRRGSGERAGGAADRALCRQSHLRVDRYARRPRPLDRGGRGSWGS